MRKYFIIILSFFTVCVSYPKYGIAEYSQMQLNAINDLTVEFEKSGVDFAKPTAEAIRIRFNNTTDIDCNFYSDILFQGSSNFGYRGKTADCEQKTEETVAWSKALNTSKLATGDTRIPSFDETAQNKCKKYGMVSACSKTGETR